MVNLDEQYPEQKNKTNSYYLTYKKFGEFLLLMDEAMGKMTNGQLKKFEKHITGEIIRREKHGETNLPNKAGCRDKRT